jgi:hypothetical protein
LVGRLRRGIEKTGETFGSLTPEMWDVVVYGEPYPWTARDLLAHFLSAEEGLLRIGREIARGGEGAPAGFDYNAFNAAEHERLRDLAPDRLLSDLRAARERTIEWVSGLAEEDLDREGRHPGLGEISLETFIEAMYGHQLLHVRDLKRALR